jgi:DNA-binding LacI/PurR family transcriptional regulator
VTYISQADIAKKAKVSISTVRRVLKEPDQVSPDKRAAILLVVKELGYRNSWTYRSDGVTLADVAAAAGVSVPTVSRCLRGGHRHADSTVARIKQLAAELGYSRDGGTTKGNEHEEPLD